MLILIQSEQAISQTPEKSDYTSIQERIHPKWKRENIKINPKDDFTINASWLAVKPLLNFIDQPNLTHNEPIPYKFIDYLELVELTGRVCREDKRGFIPANLPPITQRLGIEVSNWVDQALHFDPRRKCNQHSKINSS